ncbi:MAG: gliding motility-associated C-terminal domain-containing protein [Bacteroidota bacterium]|nr:gliding motility-associated C-terminal domain-containing protein [Bacteroidota bacterium]MDP3144505.1 gliding motility-associated C-terminal domain-containing protein [Bacteroidota bacterium]
MKRYSLLFLIFFSCHTFYAQKGKNGAGNIIASTTVNAYTPLTTDAFTGNTTINVLSAAGYGIGDLIYIIQMQGASVNSATAAATGNNSAGPFSPAHGRITNYNNAGNNEYAQISAVSGNVITIDCPLKNNYTSAGRVQVIKVPRYTSLTIGAAGVITCPAWNGSVGGVISIEVDGNTTINAGGRIDASALGFRGGALATGAFFGAGAWSHNNPQEGARKGESIAGDVATYLATFQGQYCRGAIANGGGGANSNNAGGGGGANGGDTSLYTGTGNPDVSVAGYVTAWNLELAGFATSSSSGGGRGGYTFSNANISPLTNAPGVAAWAGDNRRVVGGMGGRPLNYNTGRLFCGGGGGAGDQNDNYGGQGGRGGGIINIISYGTVSGAGQIVANGENGFNTNTTGAAPFNNCNGRDGAGGAGGGGAIVINSIGAINTITVSANGGNGGNQQMKSGFLTTTAMAYGPGGGGGGGYIGTTAAAITSFVNGGVNGIVQYLSGNENCQIDNLFPPNGSTRGGSGTVTASLLVVPTITASPDVTICVNNSANLTATTTGPPSTIGWYTNLAGPTLLGTGAAFTTSVFTTPGTYTVWAGFCPSGIYRDPVIITVTNGPTLTTTSTTVCAGQTGTISASGATTYTWNTASNSPTITAAPLATTVYTVTGSIGTCTASTTATITVNGTSSISVASSTICSGQTATLTAGAATSYTWSTGANTSTVSVSPSTTTIYTISATLAGGCVATNTATVTVNNTPTLSLLSTTICSGQTGTLSTSGATNYTWSTGANTSSITATPVATTNYTVIGANGSCTAAATATISVSLVGSIVVNSPSICAGQSATITAGLALSYTWSTGANSQSVSVSPLATTVYTVNATIAGGCVVIGTSTVTVNSNPILAIVNSTICAGQTATISASGATSYTWSNGSNSNSITASPIVNTTYTVIGANGTCTSSATASITINTSGTISANSATICSGQTATLVAGAANSYTWSTGANTQNILANPISTTIYTINATLAGGCVVSNTAMVVVNASPTVTANSASICVGQSATLTAIGATNYLWNDGTPTAINILSPTITTVYTVTGTTGNCSSIGTTTIAVTPIPTLTALSVTVCAGQVATLTANGANTYTWDPFPGTNVISSSFTASPGATTTYTLIGATNSCTSMITATVTIGANLSIAVNTPTICNGQTATLSAISTATNYVWSNGGNTATIFVNPIINTTYTVTGSEGACTGSTVANVLVNTLPNVTINANAICVGGTATISASGATTYSWSNGFNNTSSITVSPLSNTSYTVVGEVNSCTTTAIYNVTITPSPTITALNQNICNGATATLTANGALSYTWLPMGAPGNSITVNPSVNTTYTVIGDNGSCTAQTTVTVSVLSGLIAPVSSANICQGQTATIGTTLVGTSYLWSDGSTTQSISVTPNSSTSYSLLVVVGSCSYTGNSTVTVIPTPTLLLIGASICSGQTATLTASGASNGYTWNPGNLNGNSITVSPTITTNYIVTSANGICPATATTQVIVNTKPVLNIAQSAELVCPNTPVTFVGSGASIYEWYVNGNYFFGNPLLISPTQNSTITLVGSNGGCLTTTLTGLDVSEVIASFTPESNYVDFPGSLTFTNTSIGATEIFWDLGNVQTSTNNITTAYYEQPGKYLIALVAQNGMGCIDTAFYTIEAGCKIGDFYIPNTFTPNGDGLNETLQVFGGSCVTKFTGSIFDRWGNEIFKWKNIGDTWDGSYGGKQVEIGVYNYLISYTLYNGKVFTKTGHVAIIR